MKLLPIFLAAASVPALFAQGSGVAPSELLKPLKDSWPTYNGDYTGRRFSALDAIKPETDHILCGFVVPIAFFQL